MHCENIETKEIELLKMKVEILEIEKVKKDKEIADLNERVEMVEAIVAKRAASVQADITPNDKGTKKRRKAKPHPTPSPVQSHPGLSHHHPPGGIKDYSLVAEESSECEHALTAEDIAKLYEEISARADGGPRSRVCARETLSSAPHRH